VIVSCPTLREGLRLMVPPNLSGVTTVTDPFSEVDESPAG
jgi:hypothetical protein